MWPSPPSPSCSLGMLPLFFFFFFFQFLVFFPPSSPSYPIPPSNWSQQHSIRRKWYVLSARLGLVIIVAYFILVITPPPHTHTHPTPLHIHPSYLIWTWYIFNILNADVFIWKTIEGFHDAVHTPYALRPWHHVGFFWNNKICFNFVSILFEKIKLPVSEHTYIIVPMV